jgi:hypothetical protein
MCRYRMHRGPLRDRGRGNSQLAQQFGQLCPLAQPWAMASPPSPITVTHHLKRGCRDAAAMRSRALPGSPLPARCRAIGGFFEASDADVACFQEVHTYYHLALLSRQMRSFRYVSLRRTPLGPAGDVVIFSRLIPRLVS